MIDNKVKKKKTLVSKKKKNKLIHNKSFYVDIIMVTRSAEDGDTKSHEVTQDPDRR